MVQLRSDNKDMPFRTADAPPDEPGHAEDPIDLTQAVSRGHIPLPVYPSAPCVWLRHASALDFATTSNPILRCRMGTRARHMLAQETATTGEIRYYYPDPTLTAAVPTPATQQVRLHHVLCLLRICA